MDQTAIVTDLKLLMWSIVHEAAEAGPCLTLPVCTLPISQLNSPDCACTLLRHCRCHQVPLAMDCLHQHIIIASEPLELTVLALELPTAAETASLAAGAPGTAPGHARSNSSSNSKALGPQARLVPVRELSMFNPGRPLLDIALVPDVTPSSSGNSSSNSNGSNNANAGSTAVMRPRGGDATTSGRGQAANGNGMVVGADGSRGQGRASSSRREGAGEADEHGMRGKGRRRPRQCVLLRWGGLMSVLDLEQGSELALSSEVGGDRCARCDAGQCALLQWVGLVCVCVCVLDLEQGSELAFVLDLEHGEVA